MTGIGGVVPVGRHGFRTTMDDDERYEAACRAFNEALADRDDGPIEIELSATEREVLLSALAHHREIVDPNSGDAVGPAEYTCPGCGSDAEFRAQGGQVSAEAEHPAVGVEVRRYHGMRSAATVGCWPRSRGSPRSERTASTRRRGTSCTKRSTDRRSARNGCSPGRSVAAPLGRSGGAALSRPVRGLLG